MLDYHACDYLVRLYTAVFEPGPVLDLTPSVNRSGALIRLELEARR